MSDAAMVQKRQTPASSDISDIADSELAGILSAIKQTAYTWDIATDRIEWGRNSSEVLGPACAREIATGLGFEGLIAPEHLTRRQEALFGNPPADRSNGVPYRVRYRFLGAGPEGNAAIWLEDTGRWWADDTGKPERARGVIRVMDERYWEEQRLHSHGDHDELTGLLSRTRLAEALGAVLSRSEHVRQTSAFMIAAINDLSGINANLGYDVGDQVIAATGRILKDKLKGSDTLGRYSTNKFGIILYDCGPSAMRAAAERCIEAVRTAAITTSACRLTASLSIGGLMVPDQARTVPEAFSNALLALDAARQKRAESFKAFEPDAARETIRQRNITVADSVISALDDNRIRLVLQPVISAATGKPALYECLVRMERPDGTIIPAGEFITIAERLGICRLIDERTLELAVALLKKHAGLRLAVNVSSVTTADNDWIVALYRLTGGERKFTERLTIEITETAVIDDLEQTLSFITTLREMGCRIAIDDFGAGATSFKNLKLMNAHVLKIDGTFVKDLATDPNSMVFIRTMVEIAKAFNMETVAEWVSTPEAATILRDAGVTYLQGFLYGMPMTTEEMEKSL